MSAFTLLYDALTPADTRIERAVMDNVGEFLKSWSTKLVLYHFATHRVWDSLPIAPASAPTVAVGAAGNPNGAYECWYAYKNSLTGFVGDMSASATITVTNTKIEWSNLVADPNAVLTGTDKIVLYRTAAGGSMPLRVATIAHTTATYSDDIADTALLEADEEDINYEHSDDHGRMPTDAKRIFYWDHRLWYAGRVSDPNRVGYSSLGTPYFHASRTFNLGPDRNQEIRQMGAIKDTLIVFMQDTHFRITPSSDDIIDYDRNDVVDARVGCISRHASAICPANVDGRDVLAFPSEKGAYVTDGFNCTYISEEIEPIWQAFTKAELREMHVVYIKRKNWLAFYAKATKIAYCYDLSYKCWHPMNTDALATSELTGTDEINPVLELDPYGVIYKILKTDYDKVSTGTLTGTATSGSTSGLTDTTATFKTDGAALKGVPVAIKHVNGTWEEAIIASNTGTALTFEDTLTAAVAAGDEYEIATIVLDIQTKFIDGEMPMDRKQLHPMAIHHDPPAADTELEIERTLDNGTTADMTKTVTLKTGENHALAHIEANPYDGKKGECRCFSIRLLNRRTAERPVINAIEPEVSLYDQ